MNQNIFNHICNSDKSNALCINKIFYTYKDLHCLAAKIQHEIKTNFSFENKFAVVFQNDIYTYATIVAIWTSGKGYCLLNPEGTKQENSKIIQKTACNIVFNSNYIIPDALDFIDQYTIINPIDIPDFNKKLKPNYNDKNIFLYTQPNEQFYQTEIIQFKWEDVDNAIENIENLNIKINKDDKILSFFNFSHTLSVFSFILSIKSGACFYSISNQKNRAFSTFSMVEEHNITFAFTTPSAIKMLEPFFDDIPLTSLKFLLITGDVLHVKNAQNIQKCAPNAYIFNTSSSPFIFGITTAIEIDDFSQLKTYNGIVSSGYPLKNIKYIALNSEKNILNTGEIGELHVQNFAVQYSTIFNNENNLLDDNISNHVYHDNLDDFQLYRTGIIGFLNDNNAIIPIANINQQININGILIDLSLLEKHSYKLTNSTEIKAIAYTNFFGFDEIHLFIQNLSIDTNTIFQHLKKNIPDYLLPQQIHNINQMPINDNCLIDYYELVNIIKEKEQKFIKK